MATTLAIVAIVIAAAASYFAWWAGNAAHVANERTERWQSARFVMERALPYCEGVGEAWWCRWELINVGTTAADAPQLEFRADPLQLRWQGEVPASIEPNGRVVLLFRMDPSDWQVASRSRPQMRELVVRWTAVTREPDSKVLTLPDPMRPEETPRIAGPL